MTAGYFALTVSGWVLFLSLCAVYARDDVRSKPWRRRALAAELRADHLAGKVARLEAATLPDVPWFDSLSARRERDRLVLNEMSEDVSWGGDAS